MQGGDLCAALRAIDTAPVLRWYNRGAQIALDIINGLRFLHSHNVSLCTPLFDLQHCMPLQLL